MEPYLIMYVFLVMWLTNEAVQFKTIKTEQIQRANLMVMNSKEKNAAPVSQRALQYACIT